MLRVVYVNKRFLKIEPHFGPNAEGVFDTSQPYVCLPQLNGERGPKIGIEVD